jgi:ParB family protein of integrating conjugative element (PFGI_1 class)
MTKRHPSGEQIQALLRAGHFGQGRELAEGDPVSITQMLVELDRIRLYDRNPRRERNPRYDEIKASIHAQGGLNNPLTITRRPGDTYYMVESGGNTRLQILNELWQETGDERFYRVHCLFRPWVSEAHVLAAHLIENDKRGDLIFIDRALAVRELRGIIEAEQGRTLSLRELSEALHARGYGINPGLLSRMQYATEVLLPRIPEALRAGLGRPQVERLRRLEGACRHYWRDACAVEEARFDLLFAETLARHDGADWDLEAVRAELEAGLADAFAVSLKRVRLELDARLANVIVENAIAPAKPDARVEQVPPERNGHASHADPALRNAPARTIDASDHNDTPSPPDFSPSDAPPVASPGSDSTPDVEYLRKRAHELATAITEHHGLKHCVSAASALGMGFLIDVPETALIPHAGEADAMDRLYRQWVWWLLLSLSEEVVHPDRIAQLPQHMLLRTLILEREEQRVLAHVGEPDWKALGYEVLSNPAFDARTVQALYELARICRRLRGAENGNGLALWPNPETRDG